LPHSFHLAHLPVARLAPAPGLCSLVHHLIMVPAVTPKVRALYFAG